MGQITFTLKGTGAAKTETFDVLDANVDRIIDWMRDAYPTEPTPPTVEVPNPPAPPRATVAQGIRRATRGLVEGLKANTRNHEGEKARKAVSDPAPMDATAA